MSSLLAAHGHCSYPLVPITCLRFSTPRHHHLCPATPPPALINAHAPYGLPSQKKLVDWVLGYGSATLTVQFPLGWKNLQVTTLQAAVLLVFNQFPSPTVGQLADLLKIEAATLRLGWAPPHSPPPPLPHALLPSAHPPFPSRFISVTLSFPWRPPSHWPGPCWAPCAMCLPWCAC